MHASHLLGLVVLPFVAALPPYSTRGALGKRIALKENAQFNFQPFVLTKLGMDCDRQTTDEMFSCELRCKPVDLSPGWCLPALILLCAHSRLARSELG